MHTPKDENLYMGHTTQHTLQPYRMLSNETF